MNKVLGILSSFTLTTSGMVLIVSNPASAAQLWSWSYTGQGAIGGSGTFITNDGPTPYLITGITGTSQGNTITGLIAPGGLLGNDNQLTNPTPPVQLTRNGVSFSILNFSQGINIQSSQISIGFPPRNYVLTDANTGLVTRIAFTAIYVSPIPEPSSVAGTVLVGLMGLAGLKGRKKS